MTDAQLIQLARNLLSLGHLDPDAKVWDGWEVYRAINAVASLPWTGDKEPLTRVGEWGSMFAYKIRDGTPP